MLVFEDVTEEFSDLSKILQHFEDWRNSDIESYKDTYFSLCLPKVNIRISQFCKRISLSLLQFISDYWAIGPFEFINMESIGKGLQGFRKNGVV